MVSISVRTEILTRFPDLDLGQGIVHALVNQFYLAHPGTFPYASVRAMLKALQWPTHYEYIGDYPEDSNPGWTNIMQGVAHDDSHWFFSQRYHLWKIPVGHDLDEDIDTDDPPAGIVRADIPASLENKGYNHFGDLDCFAGHLYVPITALDFDGEGPQPPPQVCAFDAGTLKFVGAAAMTGPVNPPGAWCAVNPLNGLLFASPFWEDDEKPSSFSLSVYERHLLADTESGIVGLELKYLGELELFDGQGSKLVIKHIQGGAFSPRGHLYLSSDRDQGGVLGFDMIIGRKTFHHSKSSLPADVEMEGLTVWDLDDGSAPKIGGQIHLTWDQWEAAVDDDLYFSHFRVTGGPWKV